MTEEKVKQEVEKSDEKQIWCSAATNRAAIVWMIGADLWAGANLGKENPEVLLQSALRFFELLSGEERQKFVHHVTQVQLAESVAPDGNQNDVVPFDPVHSVTRPSATYASNSADRPHLTEGMKGLTYLLDEYKILQNR